MTTARRARTAATIARLLPAYLTAGVLKHVVPLPLLARWAWRSPARPSDRQEQLRLVSCVVKISKTMGATDRDCLQRSLLLYRELSRTGADPQLCVDVAPSAPGTRLRGHAWVLVDGAQILDEGKGLEAAQQVMRFGSGGRRTA